MRLRFSRLLVWVVVCLFLWTTAFAQQDNIDAPSATGMALDGLVIRPLSLVATVLGGSIFVVTLPFTIFSNTGEVWETLVVDPFEFTFRRPLGEYDDWYQKE